jgi:myosin heavy subunit
MNLGAGERNYHIFYQLLGGLKDEALKQKYHLTLPPSQFKMLTCC